MTKRCLKTPSLLLALVASVSCVGKCWADRTEIYLIRRGVTTDEDVRTIGEPIDVSVYGYIIPDRNATHAIGRLWDGKVLQSRGGKITLAYPSARKGSVYAVFFCRKGYMSWETVSTWWGEAQPDDPQGPHSVYMLKLNKAGLKEVTMFVESPGFGGTVVVGKPCGVTLTSWPAVQPRGPAKLLPDEVKEFYRYAVLGSLRILDEEGKPVHEESKTIVADFGELPSWDFSWRPTEKGVYTLVATIEPSSETDHLFLSFDPVVRTLEIEAHYIPSEIVAGLVAWFIRNPVAAAAAGVMSIICGIVTIITVISSVMKLIKRRRSA